jgi:error-prone DNA polymerase
VVRAWAALRDARAEGLICDNFKLVTGARLVFADGTSDIVAYPATRKGWGRLTRLLTVGNMRAVKGGCILQFDDLLHYLDDLLLIVMPQSSADEVEPHNAPPDYLFADAAPPKPSHLQLVPPLPPSDLAETLDRLTAHAAGRIWLGVCISRNGRDTRQLGQYRQLAAAMGVPLLATNDALYTGPECRPLHDVLTAIRFGTNVQTAGRILAPNAERYLKPPCEMVRLFGDCPEAVTETASFLARISFTLDDLRYEYPHEPVPNGWGPDDWLAHLVWAAARQRHGGDIPEKLRQMVQTELDFIRDQKFAYYFLTVHDLVRFAREQTPPILCQGRGSAANSAVCFLLGVTSVDPMQYDLLFSRFVSADRKEPPDIDVDFEHDAICLQSVRPPPRGNSRNRYPLPPAQCRAGGWQGAGPDRRCHITIGRNNMG